MIHVNGVNLFNESNIDGRQNLLAYPVCQCDTHVVSIHTVSRCNRVSQEASMDTSVPKPVLDHEQVCRSSTDDYSSNDTDMATPESMQNMDINCTPVKIIITMILI